MCTSKKLKLVPRWRRRWYDDRLPVSWSQATLVEGECSHMQTSPLAPCLLHMARLANRSLLSTISSIEDKIVLNYSSRFLQTISWKTLNESKKRNVFAQCKGIRIPEYFCLWNPESVEFLLGIRNPGIQNTAQGIQKPANEYKSGIQVPLTKNPEYSTWNPKSTACNSESKTVLDSAACMGRKMYDNRFSR